MTENAAQDADPFYWTGATAAPADEKPAGTKKPAAKATDK